MSIVLRLSTATFETASGALDATTRALQTSGVIHSETMSSILTTADEVRARADHAKEMYSAMDGVVKFLARLKVLIDKISEVRLLVAIE